MTTTHTPGPWRIERIPEVKDAPIRVESAQGDRVAQCSGISMFIDQDGCRANARLIAAAPDLLPALEGLVRFFESVRPGGRILATDPDIDAARAAIAKATGTPSRDSAPTPPAPDTGLQLVASALYEACKKARPYLADQISRGALPNGEDDSHYGDRQALTAIDTALAAADRHRNPDSSPSH